MSRSALPLLLLLGVIGAGVVLSSCDMPFSTNEDFDPASLPNQRPVARVSVSAADSGLAPTSYNEATFYWSGTDVDGFVVGFHVAIDLDDGAAPTWVFTDRDESTATYTTDANGEATPTLLVVAEDDKGALSDTVATRFPLVNFPPELEFIRDFVPLNQSFGAASFEYLGFDRDGDVTLEPWVDYRFAGSDTNRVFPIGDPDADPALGWVRLDRNPKRFSLRLRDIPEGDPDAEFEQTLFVRVLDEAGASAVFEYTWQNFEARGELMLIDDNANPSQTSRDDFYQDAIRAHLGDEFSTWDISSGLPERDEDLWLTLSQFSTIVWYTSTGTSEQLQRAQATLQRFVTSDLDPDAPGEQFGRLMLEYQAAAGFRSNLSATFRAQVLGIENDSLLRDALKTYSGQVVRDLGPLDILAQDPSLPDLVSVGQNYAGGSGVYFGVTALIPRTGAAALWRFEEYTWGGVNDRDVCGFGCSPVVAVRKPDVGPARSILLGFQLGYANELDNAVETVGILLEEHFGIPSLVGGKR